jgi:hypothetical protein
MKYVTARIGLILFWLAVLLLISGRTAEDQPAQYSIRFIAADLKLKNNQNSTTVRFNCESTWKPTGVALHLFS